MSVICNDFAWFRKDNLTSSQTHQSTPTVGSRWNKADIFVSFANQETLKRDWVLAPDYKEKPIKIEIKHILISMQVKLMF